MKVNQIIRNLYRSVFFKSNFQIYQIFEGNNIKRNSKKKINNIIIT